MKRGSVRDAIMEWNLDKVREYLINRKKVAVDLVDRLILEYRRFMILTVENPGQLVPIAGPVDDVWHTHILYTENYCAFGQAVVGGYIHHLPTANDNEAQRLTDAYHTNTFNLYRENFGEIDRSVWGENFQVCLCNGISRTDKSKPESIVNDVTDTAGDVPMPIYGNRHLSDSIGRPIEVMV